MYFEIEAEEMGDVKWVNEAESVAPSNYKWL
jgi:hypothetical protein